MARKQKYKTGRKKIIFTIIAIMVVLGGALFFWTVDPLNFKNSDSTDGINYDPPTKEEKNAVEEHKKNLDIDKDSDTNNEKPEHKNVTPFITIAQQFDDSQYGNRVEVRAYVDIVESGGKCKINFTKNDQKVTSEVETLPDVSTTVCDTVMIPREKFPSAGIWNVTVTYESPNASGTSESSTVEVK